MFRDFLATRRCRDVVRPSVMVLELSIAILEAKETLTSGDCLLIERLLKKVETLDAEFKQHCWAVIDLIGDVEEQLDKEQVLMDNHEDKVAYITEQLEKLQPESKAPSSAAHSMGHSDHLHRRLNEMERNLCLAKGKNDPLTSSPGVESCALLQLQEQWSHQHNQNRGDRSFSDTQHPAKQRKQVTRLPIRDLKQLAVSGLG